MTPASYAEALDIALFTLETRWGQPPARIYLSEDGYIKLCRDCRDYAFYAADQPQRRYRGTPITVGLSDQPDRVVSASGRAVLLLANQLP